MFKRFRTSSFVASFSVALLILTSLLGCVASQKGVSSVEDRTVEIQHDLDQLQKEMDQRLSAIERLDGKYDYNNSLVANRRGLNRVIDAIVMIRTETVFESFRASERVVKVAGGIGIVFGPYVLTLNHVVTQNSIQVLTPYGELDAPAKKLGEKAYIVFEDNRVLLKEIFRDPELDIALFQIPASNLKLVSLPCPVGNSDELYVGNFLYVVGNPFNSGINLREGIVSSLYGLEGVKELPGNRGDLFVISNGVLPGDSGVPVLVLRDGVPELVGLVQGTLGITRIGWAIKINPILREVAKHVDIEQFCGVGYYNFPS